MCIMSNFSRLIRDLSIVSTFALHTGVAEAQYASDSKNLDHIQSNYITEVCITALVDIGMTKNQGIPVASGILNKPELKIAFVEGDGEGNFPKGLFTEKLPYLWRTDQTVGKFNDNIDFEQLSRDALSYWYTGELSFVSTDQNPDLYIYAYTDSIVNGIATVPINDDPEMQHVQYYVSLLGLNMDDFVEKRPRTEQELLDTYRHEFGHSLGIIHPETAFRALREQGNTICESSKRAIARHTSYAERAGVMAMGETMEETFYERGIIQRLNELKP